MGCSGLMDGNTFSMPQTPLHLLSDSIVNCKNILSTSVLLLLLHATTSTGLYRAFFIMDCSAAYKCLCFYGPSELTLNRASCFLQHVWLLLCDAREISDEPCLVTMTMLYGRKENGREMGIKRR